MPEEKKYKFDRYEIQGKLGRGGMAIVYLARHTVLNRIVALKVLLPDFANDERIVKMFYNEAEAMARLNHKFIVKIFDISKFGSHHYFAMEYIDGNTLKDTIKRGNLSAKEIVILFTEICEAIKYIHDQGILHLDIKANNILQTKEGQIKIADFGIGKIEGKEELTKRMLVGTVEYMAPEQLRGEAVDKRADLYSLGIVLYELLTGELPYTGENKKELMKIKLRNPPEHPLKKNPFVPYRLGEIVMKLITLFPEDRYQSINEVIDDLHKEEQLISEEEQSVSEKPSEKKHEPPPRTYKHTYRAKKEPSIDFKGAFIKALKIVFLLFLLFVLGVFLSDKITIPFFGEELLKINTNITDYFKASDLKPEENFFSYINELKKAGKTEEVFKESEKFLERNPEFNYTITKDLFNYSKEVGDDVRVIKYSDRLRKFQRTSEEDLLFDLADYFDRSGKKKEALEYYKKLIELTPNSEMGKYALERYRKLIK
ncbi:MAG TPA: serine/threonine protein kinase [Firmicutes bacterium]|nr:serine/threonine protein kinase [Bacillota bacterium]